MIDSSLKHAVITHPVSEEELVAAKERQWINLPSSRRVKIAICNLYLTNLLDRRLKHGLKNKKILELES